MYVVLQTHVGHKQYVLFPTIGAESNAIIMVTRPSSELMKGGACKIAALFCLTRLSWS